VERIHQPKYKKVLAKWNKLTGKGDRTLENFINYCNIAKGGRGAPLTWMVWVYAIDIEAEFLLSSTSGLRPPEIISKEAGFRANADAGPNADVSFDNSSEDFGAASYRTPGIKSNKKARLQGEYESNKTARLQGEYEERGQRFDALVSKLETLVAPKKKGEENPIVKGYEEIQKLNSAKAGVEADDDVTPGTKAEFLSVIVDEKRTLAKRLIAAKRSEAKKS